MLTELQSVMTVNLVDCLRAITAACGGLCFAVSSLAASQLYRCLRDRAGVDRRWSILSMWVSLMMLCAFAVLEVSSRIGTEGVSWRTPLALVAFIIGLSGSWKFMHHGCGH